MDTAFEESGKIPGLEQPMSQSFPHCTMTQGEMNQQSIVNGSCDLSKKETESKTCKSDGAMDKADLLGKEFFSWEEFSNFFDAWCEQTNGLFYIKNFILLSKSKFGSDPVDPQAVETLKYSSVRLGCKNIKRMKGIGTYKVKKEDNGSEEWQPKHHRSCGAYILLKLSHGRNSLVVIECQLTHSHELCPVAFKYYFKKGYLLANACLPVRSTNEISKQFVSAQDIKRLLSYCKGPDHGVMDTLNALDYLFQNDSGAKVKLVFVENKVIVKTVFIVTSFMASLCRRFPILLFFDRIMSFNEEYDLYCFFCVDANSKGRDCAYVLTQKGTANLRFALVSLVQTIPEIKFRVRCVILGLDINEKKVVKEIFPNAQPRLIRLQVLQKLCNKAVELGAEEEKVKPLLSDMASSTSLEKYFQAVKDMDLYFTSEFIEYFLDEWHDYYELWVDIWGYKTTHIDPTTLLSHRKEVITAAVSDNASVADCILRLMVLETLKQSFQNEDDVAIGYYSVCSPDNASLIEEELGFSRHGSYHIKDTSGGFLLSDGVSEFFMDRELVTCSCTIHSSSLLPCRHLFAARFRNGEALFDLKLLEKHKDACTKASAIK
uniref:Zinc finger SWIM-type containing 9 n=2 Tax=Xenopus tropicalis TaxID=8364 RepID=A0A6I8SK81_XENTR